MNIKTIATIGVVVAIVGGIFMARAQSGGAESTTTQVDSATTMTVYKTEFCGCCLSWVDHLRANDMDVKVVNVNSTAPTRERLGVPHELGSCHTAEIAGYWFEGHVPADLIQKVMSEKPADIRGLAAPGMPAGSPGMEGPNPVKYDIVAHHLDGTTSVYATRQGQETAD